MGTEAKVDNFTSTLVGSGSKQYIQGTFNVSGLDDGDQVVVEIWVVLKSTIPLKSSGTVSATVDSAQTASGDKINSGHQSTDINKIGQFFTNEADVSVVKTDVPDPVIQGQTLNYTILVENHSPDTIANEIYVTDTLDTNTTFVSATGAPFTQNGNTLNFSIGFLTPGQNATLTINTIVADTAWADNDTSTNPEAGSVTLPTIYDLLNIVTETAITGDSNTTNNTYYQPTNVLSANPALKLTKEAAPLTYNAVDQTITYTYNVTNDGNVVVNGITVTDNKTAVTLDKTYLDPGESTKGTATYSILQEDIDAGWVTNLAVATGKYDDNKDVTSNEATATVKKVAPTGQICPTQTTCEQYMSGTAADLENAAYLFNKGTIKSVSPGVMFYYSTIVPDGTVTTISVDQSNNDSWPVMATDTKQVILYDSTCRKIAVKDVKIEGSTVTLEVDNLPEGTYYLSVKYFLSSLKNYTPTDPSATVNYSFKTSLNGNLISESKDSIDLVPKK